MTRMNKALFWVMSFAALLAFEPAAFAQNAQSTLELSFGPQKQFKVDCWSFRLNTESGGAAATGAATGRSTSVLSCRAPVDATTPQLVLAAKEHEAVRDARLMVGGTNSKGQFGYMFNLGESQLIDVAVTRIALPNGQGGDVVVDIQLRCAELGISPMQYGQTPTGKPVGTFNPNQNRQR